MDLLNFATRALHEGQEPLPPFDAVMPPIYMTSTYAQSSPGVYKGYDYTRAGNPNFTQLEKALASLENATHATCFSSGLGAVTALLTTLEKGDRVVALNGLYGGTFRLFTKVFSKFGLDFVFASETEMEKAIDKNTRLVFFETPTNPLLEVADIAHLCGLAKKVGALSVADNTFATPYFQNPIDLGADAVLHSTTKYIGGHSDVVGGVVMTKNGELKQKLDFARMAVGLNPSPFDTWLTLRGVKTLALRMEAHQQNALALATHFHHHPKVKRVFYPGLSDHPGHDVAKRQMRGFSGIVSVEFDMPQKEALALISYLKIFTLAESLGGVGSLVCHPATMTHASIPSVERERIGLSDALIRFSCGIEGTADLIADVERALPRSLETLS